MNANAVNMYLEKHANYPAWIGCPANDDLSIVLVIPCYNEPDIRSTLDSLAQCRFEGFQVEVLVVVNQSEDESDIVRKTNENSLATLKEWSSFHPTFALHSIFLKDVPAKKAGVGYARKTGMDEAVRRLQQSRHKDKIILCLDADTLVQSNYVESVHTYFAEHPKCPAASIHYAHPLDDPSEEVNKAILEYELHLRYYVLAQRWSGLKYAHQTVGSAMAVRMEDYVKQGGMNTRKAGEDFYFIHKFTHHIEFGNIMDTTVIPSARVSDRVPFGTGRAMMSILSNEESLDTYAPQSFAAIKKLVEQLPQLYQGDYVLKNSEVMAVFLRNYQFPKKVEEIRSNTSDYHSFQKRFFQWFDAFLCMKYLHFARDGYYPNIPIYEASDWLNKTYLGANKSMHELELLTKFRKYKNTFINE
jgi:glycosyltransferase involved in cell wall biosynthesis